MVVGPSHGQVCIKIVRELPSMAIPSHVVAVLLTLMDPVCFASMITAGFALAIHNIEASRNHLVLH